MEYKCLTQQRFACGDYELIPIRFEDRYKIMEWRNDQIYHLRQNEPLTKIQQDTYFSTVVSQLFEQNQPNQILFSFLKNNKLIGYGGLVHINWIDKNAEISFLMDTELEKDYFNQIWQNYLKLLEEIAFKILHFHKIYTYAFDLRPQLYESLDEAKFKLEAVLEEHCFFENRFINVVLHSKINKHE